MTSSQPELPLKFKVYSQAQIEARRKGGRARSRQFTPEYQRQASLMQKYWYEDSLALWGRQGFATTSTRYGRDFAKLIIAKKRGELWSLYAKVEKRAGAKAS